MCSRKVGGVSELEWSARRGLVTTCRAKPALSAFPAAHRLQDLRFRARSFLICSIARSRNNNVQMLLMGGSTCALLQGCPRVLPRGMVGLMPPQRKLGGCFFFGRVACTRIGSARDAQCTSSTQVRQRP